jgi:hypothetical protein
MFNSEKYMRENGKQQVFQPAGGAGGGVLYQETNKHTQEEIACKELGFITYTDYYHEWTKKENALGTSLLMILACAAFKFLFVKINYSSATYACTTHLFS